MKGSYLLLLRAIQQKTITVGKLGQLQVLPGFYVYCGSAFGPGGLDARIGRHLRAEKKLRWHIDYLRSALDDVTAYFLEDANVECCHAHALVQAGARIPLKGFGSSDCRCDSHLLYFEKKYPLEVFFKENGLTKYQHKGSVA